MRVIGREVDKNNVDTFRVVSQKRGVAVRNVQIHPSELADVSDPTTQLLPTPYQIYEYR
jgi:hypothetical protein